MQRRLSLLILIVLAVTASLEASGRRRASSPFLKVEGLLAAVSPDEVTVRTRHEDVTVKLLPATVVTVDRVPVSTALLVVGEKVDVFAWRSPDGVLTAAWINVEGEDEVKGVIQSVTPPALVVDTNEGVVTLTLTPETVILVHGVQVAPEALLPGMRIEAKTARGPAGERIALVVHANTSLTGLRGRVTAIDGPLVTILTGDGASIVLTLNDMTVIKHEGRVVSPALLHVGSLLRVKTLVSGDQYLAIVIEIERASDFSELKGTITQIGTDSVTILAQSGEEVTVRVDDETIIRFGGHRVITLADLVVGDEVRVHATPTETGLLAVKIRVLDDDGRYDEFEGTIVAVTGSVLTIEKKNGTTVDVNVTSQTYIRRRFEPATIADLQPGVKIELTVRHNADGSNDALFIAIEGHERGEDREVEIKGAVVSATDHSVTVLTRSGAVTVEFDGQTEFKNGSAEDLVAGRRVEIEAVRRDDGTLLAKKIEIEDRDDDEREVELKGLIVTATANSLTVHTRSGDVTVAFNAQTEFKGGSAGDLVAGRRVEVDAVRLPEGSLLAKKIELEDED